jgi:hypothetical protein
MLGFTQSEVNGLLDDICLDYDISLPQRREIEAVIINHYNGYHFVSQDIEAVFINHYNGYHFVSQDIEAVFNPTLLAYFFDQFCRHRKFPRFLTDMSLRTYGK